MFIAHFSRDNKDVTVSDYRTGPLISFCISISLVYSTRHILFLSVLGTYYNIIYYTF